MPLNIVYCARLERNIAMVDGINNNNDKQWTKINDTTKDKDYQSQLNKKINSILNGNETISVEELRQNSLFKDLSEQATVRFNQVARIDGDKTSFNSDELKVLFSLTDASLQNNSFVFDGKDVVDKNSGLEQTTDDEIKVMIKNLVQSDVRKRVETVDVSKYDKTKPFETKLSSGDVDEAMLAVQDKLTLGINKSTGKPISVTQAVVMLQKYVKDQGYDEGCKTFTEETGIPASNFSRLRCMGDGDSFIVGDWEYKGAETLNEKNSKITNIKTGEVVYVKSSSWRNATNHTIPATDGYVCMVQGYNDANTSVEFTYGDDESIAPTSSNVTINGKTKSVQYNQKFRIDPDLYNYLETRSSRINL